MVTFEWQQVLAASHYSLQVNNVDTGEVVIRENQLTSVTFTPAANLPPGNYRIWVRAISSSGTLAPWSLKQDFSTA
ncbi:MAG: hypothetical protein R3C49_11075 [Planctomycetaceae bacterium]